MNFIKIAIFFTVASFLVPATADAFSGSGAGTIGDPFQITTCVQLQEMVDNKSAHYILMNNIDCSDTVNWNSGAGFLPIGDGFSVAASFSGTFNGNEKVISDLFINRPATNMVGLFGITYGGHIYDVGLEDVNITGAQYTGGLIGHLHWNSGTPIRGTIERVYTTGTVSGTTRVGGIVGEQSLGDITNSYSRANVEGRSGSWIGGLAGVVSESDSSTSRLATKGISNSYATGNVVTATHNIRGGFSGGDGARVSNSFAVGNVSTGGSNGGGFHGRTTDSVTSNNYWYNHAGNPNTCVGTTVSGTFSCTAITDIDHFKNSSNAPLTSWDFVDTWAVDGSNNDGFPYLQWQSFVPPDITPPAISSISTSNASSTGITISWVTDEDSSTRFVYSIGLDYASTTAEENTSPRTTNHSQSISNLVPCTLYNFRVISRDASSNVATSTASTFLTTGCEGSAIPASATSTPVTVSATTTKTVASGNSTITVETPADFTATSSTVVLQIKSLSADTVLESIGKPSSSLNKVGSTVFDIKAMIDNTTELNSFDIPVTITYGYSDEDISGLDESTLWLYHYKDDTWSALDNCSVNTSANTITCTAPHFSIFALFGNLTPSESSSQSSVTANTAGIRTAVSSIQFGCRDIKAMNYSAFVSHRQEYCIYESNSSVTRGDATSESTGSRSSGVSGAIGVGKFMFNKNLQTGTRHSDVKELQKFLNATGFTVSASGSGSAGNETDFFGSATRRALIRYQQANNIRPAIGFFGPITRRSVNN
jgi:hypothetical protein